jgi:hypothetical protein
LLPFSSELSIFSPSVKNANIEVYEAIILPLVLYGCETWSLTLREVHIVEMYENRMLGRLSGPKREEVIGGWRKLHNEELHNLPYVIRMIKSRRMRWLGHVSSWGRRGLHAEFR